MQKMMKKLGCFNYLKLILLTILFVIVFSKMGKVTNIPEKPINEKEETLEIIQPKKGEFISELRPEIKLKNITEADNYIIEISPEPSFSSNNTITYTAGKNQDGNIYSGGTPGLVYYFPNKLYDLFGKYKRYKSIGEFTYIWKVPYNLTAMTSYPYGYRIVQSRDWLKMFAERVAEGYDDPAEAIHDFVTYGIINSGATAEYYNAYQMLSRDNGTCGNTSELTATLYAALGYKSRLLSLYGNGIGHIAAELQIQNGKWIYSDALYNFKINESVKEIIKNVNTNHEFLDIYPYFGAQFKYRDLFGSVNFSYSTETTYNGVQYTTEDLGDKGTDFDDIKYTASSDMEKEIKQQKVSKFTNVFFIRATYYNNGKWSNYAKSYFFFKPNLNAGEEYIDNIKNIWLDGKAIPDDFK